MTFSINGVSLDSKNLGWEIVRGSVLVLGTEYSVPSGESAGLDGIRPLPSVRKAGSLQFKMKVKNSSRSALMCIFSTGTLKIRDTDKPNWIMYGRLLSSAPEKFYAHKDWGVDLFVIEIPEGAWRYEQSTTTPEIKPIAGSTEITLFNGISAPVQDAIVRFEGGIQNPQITDSSGAYVKVNGTVPAGQYIRFESKSGRAWQTTTDTWTGGTEVSGNIDFGGPRSVFEITPAPINVATPLQSQALLTLTQTSYDSGAAIQIRGNNAYIF